MTAIKSLLSAAGRYMVRGLAVVALVAVWSFSQIGTSVPANAQFWGWGGPFWGGPYWGGYPYWGYRRRYWGWGYPYRRRWRRWRRRW